MRTLDQRLAAEANDEGRAQVRAAHEAMLGLAEYRLDLERLAAGEQECGECDGWHAEGRCPATTRARRAARPVLLLALALAGR